MRQIWIILFTIIVLSIPALGQESDEAVMDLDFNTVSFKEFADILQEDHGVFIFYKSEWTQGISISCESDSTTVSKLLDQFLKPRGINFVYRGNKQYFLTGPELQIDL